MSMKRWMLLLGCLLFAGIVCADEVQVPEKDSTVGVPDREEIEIGPGEPNDDNSNDGSDGDDLSSGRPRTGTLIPFECFYWEGVISLEFTANIGVTYLTVTHLATNQTWSVSGDSACGLLEVAFADGSGEYLIYVESGYGECWHGYLTLE